MPSDIKKALQHTGLTEDEIAVYLASLELGQASVLEIARKAGVKRPTTYLILDALAEKGLVNKLPRKHKTTYAPEAPDNLLSSLKQREQMVREVLPTLKGLYQISGSRKPQVHFYEGSEGVRTVYRLLWEEKDFIFFYGSIREIVKEFKNELFSYEVVAKKELTVREIVPDNPVDRSYARETNAHPNPRHHIKLMPEGMNLLMDSAIMPDRIIIVSLQPMHFGIVIESREIALSYKNLFEMAWGAAREP